MDFYQRLLLQVTEMARATVGNMVRVGTVYEVKGDKLRMNMGVDVDGKPVLSPWLHTSSMRGGARERRFYKKGQNIAILSPTGDPRQGIILPYAPNKNFLAPDHANKSGQDEEVYQLDDLRVKKTKEGYDIWLQPPKQNQSSKSGHLTQMPTQNGDGNSQALMKLRLNRSGGITGRVGKMRFHAHKKGAKIKANKDFVAVVDGQIISSQPIIIGDDPIPDDNQ